MWPDGRTDTVSLAMKTDPQHSGPVWNGYLLAGGTISLDVDTDLQYLSIVSNGDM